MTDEIPPLAEDSWGMAQTCVTCESLRMHQGRMICQRMDHQVMEYHVCDLYQHILCNECMGASLVLDHGGELIACPSCFGEEPML